MTRRTGSLYLNRYAPDGVARRAREICLGTMFFVDKPDPPERKGASLPQRNVHLSKGRYALWKDSFSAGFVDGRLPGIQNRCA